MTLLPQALLGAIKTAIEKHVRISFGIEAKRMEVRGERDWHGRYTWKVCNDNPRGAVRECVWEGFETEGEMLEDFIKNFPEGTVAIENPSFSQPLTQASFRQIVQETLEAEKMVVPSNRAVDQVFHKLKSNLETGFNQHDFMWTALVQAWANGSRTSKEIADWLTDQGYMLIKKQQ